jgi:hypothetical protein
MPICQCWQGIDNQICEERIELEKEKKRKKRSRRKNMQEKQKKNEDKEEDTGDIERESEEGGTERKKLVG